jgi:diaminopimelate decarboxylase/aspartate kinase
MTSGPKSKFGVSHQELSRITELAKKADAEIIGLHAHVGSGILAAETWAETAGFLVNLALKMPSVKILDLGGGLGVSEKEGQTPLDVKSVEMHLKKFQKLHPQFELWMEPGRYLVAEGGVLLASVTQLKEKNGKTFIGLNAGMNSLIRPSLYGSWHQISNLSQIEKPASIIADVVGPICESGDVIGHDRSLPITAEGDICLIAMTGAYGRVMASNYNLRKPAEEITIKENSSRTSTKKISEKERSSQPVNM